MIECDMDPSFDDDQYLVLTQDEWEEGDEGVISYWSEDDGDWFLDEPGGDFSNKGELLYDISESIRMWEPLKDED